jgi:Mycoplasma protein of unknown function, DUF285.
MAFTLVTKPKPRTLEFCTNPTQDRINYELDRGMSRINYDNGCFFVNMNDEYDQDRVKAAVGVEDFKWFHETTGNKNWVLYNPKYFKTEYNNEDKFILKFKARDYDGTPVSMPINASSMCSMFSWMELPKNLNFESRFNMDNILDASMMFTGCLLNGFELPWDTSHCLFMRYMFYECSIPNKAWVKNINTRYCINTEYMFGKATIADGVVFDLYTLNTINMHKMFFATEFKGSCDLGVNFMYPANKKSYTIFEGAKCGNIDLFGRPLHEIKSILGCQSDI